MGNYLVSALDDDEEAVHGLGELMESGKVKHVQQVLEKRSLCAFLLLLSSFLADQCPFNGMSEYSQSLTCSTCSSPSSARPCNRSSIIAACPALCSRISHIHVFSTLPKNFATPITIGEGSAIEAARDIPGAEEVLVFLTETVRAPPSPHNS